MPTNCLLTILAMLCFNIVSCKISFIRANDEMTVTLTLTLRITMWHEPTSRTNKYFQWSLVYSKRKVVQQDLPYCFINVGDISFVISLNS